MSLGKTDPKEERLIEVIAPLISPLGFNIVSVETNTHKSGVLRVFIEREDREITLDDCASVSRALNDPFEESPVIEEIFKGNYNLEVSSPGLFRSLKSREDLKRFEGERARIQVYRPLTSEESRSSEFQEKYPKQKVFVGVIGELAEKHIRLDQIELESGSPTKSQKNSGKATKRTDGNSDSWSTHIPLEQITKASLEPNFELKSSGNERTN